jgi:DNA-binding response OmpR family regulator
MSHFVALAVGRDPQLLETRSQVLRNVGYTVVSALSVEQALQSFASGDFDIVILCHSIPARDRERLTYALKSHGSNTPVVVVTARLSVIDSFADAMIENDPEMLLQQIPRILQSAREQFQREPKRARV